MKSTDNLIEPWIGSQPNIHQHYLLSTTTDGRVLCNVVKNDFTGFSYTIYVYNSDGIVLTTFDLGGGFSPNSHEIRHVIMTNEETIIACTVERRDKGKAALYEITKAGNTLRSWVVRKPFNLRQSDCPGHFVADKNGDLILVLPEDNQVILVDRASLRPKCVLVATDQRHKPDAISLSAGKRSKPHRICFDEATGQLFVAMEENGILVYQIS